MEWFQMSLVCDSLTEEYLRQIVVIHSRRMVLEEVIFWWKDEPLMVVIVGLVEAKKIELPSKPDLQIRAIADFCTSCCRIGKIYKHPFILRPATRRTREYTETMERVRKFLLVS